MFFAVLLCAFASVAKPVNRADYSNNEVAQIGYDIGFKEKELKNLSPDPNMLRFGGVKLSWHGYFEFVQDGYTYRIADNNNMWFWKMLIWLKEFHLIRILVEWILCEKEMDLRVIAYAARFGYKLAEDNILQDEKKKSMAGLKIYEKDGYSFYGKVVEYNGRSKYVYWHFYNGMMELGSWQQALMRAILPNSWFDRYVVKKIKWNHGFEQQRRKILPSDFYEYNKEIDEIEKAKKEAMKSVVAKEEKKLQEEESKSDSKNNKTVDENEKNKDTEKDDKKRQDEEKKQLPDNVSNDDSQNVVDEELKKEIGSMLDRNVNYCYGSVHFALFALSYKSNNNCDGWIKDIYNAYKVLCDDNDIEFNEFMKKVGPMDANKASFKDFGFMYDYLIGKLSNYSQWSASKGNIGYMMLKKFVFGKKDLELKQVLIQHQVRLNIDINAIEALYEKFKKYSNPIAAMIYHLDLACVGRCADLKNNNTYPLSIREHLKGVKIRRHNNEIMIPPLKILADENKSVTFKELFDKR